MRYFIFVFLFSVVSFFFYSGAVSAQDCPTNTSENRWYVGGDNGTYYATREAACVSGYINYNNAEYGIMNIYNQCMIKRGSSAFVATFGSKPVGSGTCGCPAGQFALGNGSSAQGCYNNITPTPPNTCDASTAYDGSSSCGSANGDCEATGGALGFFNDNPVCIPSDYGDYTPEDSSDDSTGSCPNGGAKVWGGSDGLLSGFGCAGGTSDPVDPVDPVDPPDDQTPDPQTPSTDPPNEGGKSSTGGAGTDSETGQACVVGDAASTCVPDSCNPLTDSYCEADAGNKGSGQCDPEAKNYESCTKSSQLANPASSCASPPVCTGDAIRCAGLQQDFNLECSVSVSGTEQCATFSCTGNALLCEPLRLKALESCEAFKATRSAVIADLDAFGLSSGLVSIDDLAARNNDGYRGIGDFESIDVSDDLPAEYIEQFAGSCSLSLESDLGAIGGAIALQETEICGLASNIRPFVMFSAYLFSALFIGRIVGGAL
jgi:hypothetical protein